MKSIARTLTFSLSVAAGVIFIVVMIIVVWLDQVNDGDLARCEATAEILGRAASIVPDTRIYMNATEDLEALKADSKRFWYVVSYAGQLSEYAPELRPALPFTLPYTGPIGHSVVTPLDHKTNFCLDVRQRGASQLVIMAGGANLDFGLFIKTFILRHHLILLLIASAFGATVVAGTRLSSRFVERSIDHVTKMALAIEPTSPHRQIPISRVPCELTALVNALNRAFYEIDGHMQRQQRFLGNAAHELRTPLTLLRAKIEEVSDASVRADLVRDIRRITLLVSAMLDLARLQNRAIEKRPIDLAIIAREVLADFGPSALNCGVDLSLVQEEAPVIVEGVEAAVRSALANLVGNALIHARGATKIVARLKRETVTIIDNGGHLQSNNDFDGNDVSKQSNGLGLSIVREIMVAHGGSLTIATECGKGTTACLTFPQPKCPEAL